MPAVTVDFYWDVGSTNTYFAWHLIKPVIARHQAALVLHPFNLGYVFRTHNYQLMDEPKDKLKNRKRDLQRWADRYRLPFRMPDQFPIKSSVALRASLVAREMGAEWAFVEAILARYWETNDPSIQQVDGLLHIAEGLGLNRATFAARLAAPQVRQGLIDSTQKALDRGVFGAPFIAVGDELYWGKDRMEFVDDHLARLVAAQGEAVLS